MARFTDSQQQTIVARVLEGMGPKSTADDWERAARDHEAAGRTECARVCREEAAKAGRESHQ